MDVQGCFQERTNCIEEILGIKETEIDEFTRKDLRAFIGKKLSGLHSKKIMSLEEIFISLFWRTTANYHNNLLLVAKRLEQWNRFLLLLSNLINKKMYIKSIQIAKKSNNRHQTSGIALSQEFHFTITGVPSITMNSLSFPSENCLFRDRKESWHTTSQTTPVIFDLRNYFDKQLLIFILDNLEALETHCKIIRNNASINFEVALGFQAEIIMPVDMQY